MVKRFIFLVLALSLFAISALAQTNTGNLTGTVSDPSGILQGATVVVTDDKTGKEKTVVTNDAGGFSVAQLDVGTYTVNRSQDFHRAGGQDRRRSNLHAERHVGSRKHLRKRYGRGGR